MKDRRILSSLPLQISLYFDGYYVLAFMLVNVILIFYKSFKYTYSHSERALDVIVLIFWGFSDISRLVLARKGNKCEDIYALFINLGLSLPVILGHVFFYLWQTIILDLDKILNVIGLIFVVSEIILSGLAIMTFVRNKRQV
eukprot:UN11385